MTYSLKKFALPVTLGLAFIFTVSCGEHSLEELLGLDSSSSEEEEGLLGSSSSEGEGYSSSSLNRISSSSRLGSSSSSSLKISSSSLKLSSSSLQQSGKETGDWNLNVLDVARDVDYLSDIEKDVILELNMVRSNPKKYAELYIQPRLEYFNGNRYSEPGKTTIITQEGAVAVQECIDELSQTAGIGILTHEKGLYLAAKDHADDLGTTGQRGHVGSDGSTMGVRVKRYGTYSSLGETISYGKNTGRSIVLQLLIDDGVPERGHRKIIMNGTYTSVGTSVGTHPQYNYLCVTDYAKGYRAITP